MPQHMYRTNRLLLYVFFLLPGWGFAQEDSSALSASGSGQESSAETQANNPLADFKAFNIQNYYIPELSGPIETTANIFVLRYAQPFGKWLMRASLPFNRTPTGINTTDSGVGDFDAFFAYLSDTGNPARSFGLGPQLVLPTASEDATGSGKSKAGWPPSTSMARQNSFSGAGYSSIARISRGTIIART